MNWLEIIKLLVVLWPIIEKIIAAIDGDANKAKATDQAIAAVVQVATANVTKVPVEADALLAVMKSLHPIKA